ncbi:DUF3618 domain-containing protein [Actinoplanes sp. NPDC051513]|uniref:DUF3618 domain-containing protein n=1 Tax=Actinoplanes sp. NPDC051513 TaxID=3363908 RepID=UPI0037912CEB
MSEQTSDKAAAPVPKPTIDELRAEIKQTRADLGETVQALAAKADVKARALDQVEVAKQRAREAVSASPVPIALAVAGVAALVGIILVTRGRRR